MYFRMGSTVSYIHIFSHRHLHIVYSLTDWILFHVNAYTYTCIFHVLKLLECIILWIRVLDQSNQSLKLLFADIIEMKLVLAMIYMKLKNCLLGIKYQSHTHTLYGNFINLPYWILKILHFVLKNLIE